MKAVYIITSEVGLTPVVFTDLKKASKRIVDLYMSEHQKALIDDPVTFVKCEVEQHKRFVLEDSHSFRVQLTKIEAENFNPIPKSLF